MPEVIKGGPSTREVQEEIERRRQEIAQQQAQQLTRDTAMDQSKRVKTGQNPCPVRN